jgi:hypothetical protein
MSNLNTITRRETLALGAAALTSALTPIADAVESSEHHGLSAFGDLKYPADFRQFDYVNANAPKGGLFSHVAPAVVFNQNPLTFNSLNAFILKGDAAQGMELTFASLMMRAYDEPSGSRLPSRFLHKSGIARRQTWHFNLIGSSLKHIRSCAPSATIVGKASLN